jgi:hypothetical protein
MISDKDLKEAIDIIISYIDYRFKTGKHSSIAWKFPEGKKYPDFNSFDGEETTNIGSDVGYAMEWWKYGMKYELEDFDNIKKFITGGTKDEEN